MRLPTSVLLAALAVTSCVADDPELSGAKPSGDAGASLPLIDRWDYSVDEVPGAVAGCVLATDDAVNAMGGSYAEVAATQSNARVAARRGAALYTFCAANGGTSLVVTAAVGVAGALDAQNDNQRLLDLFKGVPNPPVASALSPSAPALRTADGVGTPKAGLTQALCQERAKAALEAAFAGAPEQWSDLGGTFVAIGGARGTTAAITCLALDLRALAVNVVTIDPAVDPSDVVVSVTAELAKLGAL